MQKKLLKLILPILLALCLCSACVFLPDTIHEGESDVKLTQRQIEILEREGLPTDYAQLLTSQKRDIVAIEEMLCYLEETYQTEAEYVSFTQGSYINNEMLRAKMNGMTVELERSMQNGDYVYKDNYATLLAQPEYEEALGDFFRSKDLNVKVYGEMILENNGAENILAKANGAPFVFLQAELSRQELEALAQEYVQWYLPQLEGLSNTTRIYVVPQELFEDLDRVNYTDLQREVAKENKIICFIYPDGSFETE